MPNNDTFYKELDCVDREDLLKAGSNPKWDTGEARYCFYRGKGYCKADALAYALAWCRNSAEQAGRRKDHMTGCLV